MKIDLTDFQVVADTPEKIAAYTIDNAIDDTDPKTGILYVKETPTEIVFVVVGSFSKKGVDPCQVLEATEGRR